MKRKTHAIRTKPRRAGRARGVSRVHAAAIARARLARVMIRCEVSEEMPMGYSVYQCRPLPKKCWFVCWRPRYAPMTTGGTLIVLCISRRSGRVLRMMELRGE